MTLQEFLNRKNKFPNNAYVDEPGFNSLYVRDTYRRIEGQRIKTIDIASVEVEHKGTGIFTNLIKKLHSEHNLYIECVTTQRFEKLLLRLGFKKQIDTGSGFPSYYLLKNVIQYVCLTCGIKYGSRIPDYDVTAFNGTCDICKKESTTLSSVRNYGTVKFPVETKEHNHG